MVHNTEGKTLDSVIHTELEGDHALEFLVDFLGSALHLWQRQ